jgi:hypothetical protein
MDKYSQYRIFKTMKINEIESSNSELQAGQKEKQPDVDSETLIQLLERDCKTMCDTIRHTGKFLFRGIKNAPARVFKGRSRENRKPKDSHPTIDTLVNFALEREGFIARRNNSIFTTSNLSDSQSYGLPYMIFPVDSKFSFTWSKKYDDFYVRMEQYSSPEKVVRLTELIKEHPDWATIAGQFDNTNFNEAVNSGHEVYIHGEYYAVCAIRDEATNYGRDFSRHFRGY